MSDDMTEILKSALERFEKLAEEKQELSEVQKEIKAELKSHGYDVVAFLQVVARRKMEREAVTELDETVALYELAIE